MPYYPIWLIIIFYTAQKSWVVNINEFFICFIPYFFPIKFINTLWVSQGALSRSSIQVILILPRSESRLKSRSGRIFLCFSLKLVKLDLLIFILRRWSLIWLRFTVIVLILCLNLFTELFFIYFAIITINDQIYRAPRLAITATMSPLFNL